MTIFPASFAVTTLHRLRAIGLVHAAAKLKADAAAAKKAEAAAAQQAAAAAASSPPRAPVAAIAPSARSAVPAPYCPIALQIDPARYRQFPSLPYRPDARTARRWRDDDVHAPDCG